MPGPAGPRAPNPGFGLGLRTPHYPAFLAGRQRVDWLEIVTDNFLVEGGRPLATLDRLRRDYPMAMHGVAMSLGAPGGPDEAYLRQVRSLADRVQPLWVSDHLCWIGPGPTQLHDLFPLPYTEEAARRVIAAIERAQEVLGRRLVLENVSSYVAFRDSACTEWQFLDHVARSADCLLLVDVNNVYVSSVNHGFDPRHYLDGLPADRVQQIHLAGHSRNGAHVIDTHDHPVAAEVWALYAHACQRYGPVATMIERDEHIPPLPELIAELDRAREIASGSVQAPASATQAQLPLSLACPPALPLTTLQHQLADYILGPVKAPADALSTHVQVQEGVDPAQRLGIYHHAYRARLAEVLADSFARTARYMGDAFQAEAEAHAVAEPPRLRSLGRYGSEFPAFLERRFPHNPELYELARLDWDLRACFDGPDVAALDADAAAADAAQSWLARRAPLHPSLRLRPVTSNVVALWNALDADEAVPPAQALPQPRTLAVWRKGLQPHFQTLEPGPAAFLAFLAQGGCVLEACASLGAMPEMADAANLAAWLRDWWSEGLLRADPAPTS